MTTYEILISLKKTILKKLPLIFLFSLLLSSFVAFYSSQLPEYRIAYTKIFPLSINSNKSSSPLDDIKAQFGMGGKSDNEAFDLTELSSSKKLSFKILKSQPKNKKYPHYYDWLIEEYNKNETNFFNPKFVLDKKDTIGQLIAAQKLYLKNLQIVKGENKYFTLTFKSTNKDLAKEISEEILIVLSEFYIDFTTEKPKQDLLKIKEIKDSLKAELYTIERAMAGFTDANTYSSTAISQLPQAKLQRLHQEIEAIYSITTTTYQNARFKLLSESPIFQILDYPGEPYGYEKESWKKNAILIFIISFFLLSFFFCRKIFGAIIIDEFKKN
ncbi:MAG: hypothetical protein KA275_00480 [Chitinophagaceae bacterium]|nr:hypothetical protein [Chitinophagaceae bacterium]